MSQADVITGIKQHRRFLLTAHVDPEGDSIGSELAMGRLLTALGKHVDYANDGPVPAAFEQLPGIAFIRRRRPRSMRFDALVTVDCPTLERIGSVARLLNGHAIINVDHHVSNTYFGTHNWVEPKAAAAGELVYRLFHAMKVRIDRTSALHLYLAIMTDTGSFRFSNTTPETLRIAAELLQHGIQPEEIYRMAYDASSVRARKLLAECLETLQSDPKGEVTWIKVTRAMLRRHQVELADTEEFVNYARGIKGVKVAVCFKETGQDGLVKASFRSNVPKINVSEIASQYGGGGHMAAAGCVLKGRIDHLIPRVVKYVKAYMKEVRG